MSKTLLPQLPTTRRWGSSTPRAVTSATPKSTAERIAAGMDGKRRAPPSRPTTAFAPEQTNGMASIQGSRPKSGKVRPLSGRVFIRRTVKNGWVAKGVDGSQIDLDGEDEEWDTNSLDSFFDDDFENQETKEVLGNLLSCNTLGVGSKGRRPDWKAGGLAIPEFHCPRCRDHWYGLSSFPCDEELARLIREGLWYTGKGDPKKRGQGTKDNEHGGIGSGEKRDSSYTNLHDLPDINSRTTGFRTKKSEHGIDFIDPNRGKKKSQRRITFRIEGNNSDDDDMQSGSSSKLLGNWKGTSRSQGVDDDAIPSQRMDSLGLGSLRSTQKYDSDGKNGNTSSSTSDLNSGSSTNLLHSKRDKASKSGMQRVKSGKGRRRRPGVGDDSTTSGKTEDGSDPPGRQRLKGRNATDAWGEQKSEGNGEQGADTDANLLSMYGQNQQGSEQASKTTYKSTDDGSASGQDKTGDSAYGERRNQSNSLSSSKAGGSRTSLCGSQGSRGGTDSRKGPVGKGYMRVPSASNRDWGDPTHALPWASNTASSSRVSLTHSTGRHDNSDSNNGGKDNDEKWAVSIPSIPPSQNMSSFFDFPAGFQLTRAFTYSYY